MRAYDTKKHTLVASGIPKKGFNSDIYLPDRNKMKEYRDALEKRDKDK